MFVRIGTLFLYVIFKIANSSDLRISCGRRTLHDVPWNFGLCAIEFNVEKRVKDANVKIFAVSDNICVIPTVRFVLAGEVGPHQEGIFILFFPLGTWSLRRRGTGTCSSRPGENRIRFMLGISRNFRCIPYLTRVDQTYFNFRISWCLAIRWIEIVLDKIEQFFLGHFGSVIVVRYNGIDVREIVLCVQSTYTDK